MDQRDTNACGAHKLGEAIPGSYFDYTCDDCMLPYNHKDYDPSNYKERIQADNEPKKSDELIPF